MTNYPCSLTSSYNMRALHTFLLATILSSEFIIKLVLLHMFPFLRHLIFGLSLLSEGQPAFVLSESSHKACVYQIGMYCAQFLSVRCLQFTIRICILKTCCTFHLSSHWATFGCVLFTELFIISQCLAFYARQAPSSRTSTFCLVQFSYFQYMFTISS